MSFLTKIRDIKESAINLAMNHTDGEQKVREATNGDEAWGPHGSIMKEISAMTFHYEDFPEVMGMLWKRMLKDKEGKHWRRIYKSLLLLDFLLKNGSDRVVESARDHLYDLRGFENFAFIDAKGKDQGVNVKQKSKDLVALLKDDEELREQRNKSKESRDKYVGVANPEYGGGGSNNWDSGKSSNSRAFEDDWNANKQQNKNGRKPYSDNNTDADEDEWSRKQKNGRAPDESPGKPDSDWGAFPSSNSSSPPTNNTNNNNTNNNDGSFADFAPRGPEPVAVNNDTGGGLVDLLGSPVKAETTPTDDWGAFGSSNNKQQQQPAAVDNSGFGDFTTSTAVPQQPQPNNNNFTAFASAPQPTSSGFGDFNSAPAVVPQMQMPVQQQQQAFGSFASTQPVATPTMTNDFSMMSMSTTTPTSNTSTNLLGGDLLGGPTTSTTTTTSSNKSGGKIDTSNTTWSGLDISLDNLGGKPSSNPTPGSVFGERRESGPKSVFGDSLSSKPAPQNNQNQMGMQQQQPMGGMNQMGMGMGMGMQQQQQPMGGMNQMGMNQMGMNQMGMQQQQQPMGGMNQMGMNQMGMNQMGMQQQPMGGMNQMGGMGMGMQQQQQPMGGMQGNNGMMNNGMNRQNNNNNMGGW